MKKFLRKLDSSDRAFSELEAEAEMLFVQQNVRNPMHAEMTDLLQRYKALDIHDKKIQAASLISQAKIHDALDDAESALAALAQVFRHPFRRFHRLAAVHALEISRYLSTKKYSRRIQSESARSNIALTLEKIIADIPDSEEKRRLEVYFSMYVRDVAEALKKSWENSKSGRNLADLIFVITTILYRGDVEAYAPQIAQIISDMDETLRRAGQSHFIAGVKAQNGGILVKSGHLPKLSVDEVRQSLLKSNAREIRAYAASKPLFLFNYEDAETTKLEIVKAYKERGMGLAPGSQELKKLLEKTAQTETFWRDEHFRNETLSEIEDRIGAPHSPDAYMVLGSIALLRADLNKASVFFKQSVATGTQFERTGATSFFTDLTGSDEKEFTEAETQFESISRTDAAYVCCADLKYFVRYGREYATSFRTHGGVQRLHFHIAASDFDSALKTAQRELRGYDNVSYSFEIPKNHTPTYYASMRFLRAPDFLVHVAKRIVLTDIDVAFRTNPDRFIRSSIWEAADVGFRVYDKVRILKQASVSQGALFRYPRLLPWAQVNAACLVLTDTTAGRAAAQGVSRDMHRHLGRALTAHRSAWWIDQNSLLMTLLALQNSKDTRIANIEDVGLPYGSFSYEGSRSLPGRHPLFMEMVVPEGATEIDQ